MKETVTRIKTGINNNKIPMVCTLLVVAGMIFFSEVLGEKEIIFPEVTALAIGTFLAPKLSWNTSFRRMFLLICICAISGVAIVLYLPVPMWAQFTIAYVFSQIVLLCSKTTFAPMISAIMLPVMLQTESMVYIGAAFLLTMTMIVLRLLLEKAGVKEKSTYIPEKIELKKDIPLIVVRSMVVCALSVVVFCLGADLRFMIAPPLLVFFTEITKRSGAKTKERENFSIEGKNGTTQKGVLSVEDKKQMNQQMMTRLKKGIPFITLCALTGVICRYVFTVLLGLPLTISAVIAILFMILYLYAFDAFMPPAGAMTILAMLIPETMMLYYPMQVFLGVFVLSMAGVVIKGKVSVCG